MSGSDTLGLIGFFTGVILHIFLLSIVLKRPERRRFETVLLSLLVALLTWYSGNFISTLLRQMDISKVSTVLTSVDLVTFISLGLLPALLLHTHWVYYTRGNQPSTLQRRVFIGLIAFLYFAILLFPAALPQLLKEPAKYPLQKLGPFTGPYLVLLALSYGSSVFIQVQIFRQTANPVERGLFRRLAVCFLVIPVFNFWVFGLGGAELGGGAYFVLIALMASLFPTFLVAYFIYRHQFLQITVHRSLASAFLVLLILLAYLAGIRRIGQYLETELSTPPLLLEGTFLVTLLLFFPPLSGWLQDWVSRSFSKDIERFRNLSEAIGRTSSAIFSRAELTQFIQGKIEKEFPAGDVKLHLSSSAPSGNKELIYPLRSGSRVFGYLEFRGPIDKLSAAQREGLRLLSDEIGGALERCDFLEKQLSLERELGKKSQLEALGRTAATIAHNVKNPLSSIRTLMQLQGEAKNLTTDQKKESKMVIQEIDRLSKTVTSLLRFSRLDQTASSNKRVNVKTLLESVQIVFRGGLEEKDLVLETRMDVDPEMTLSHADHLKDILANLLSNAIDAGPPGSTIKIDALVKKGDLIFLIEDQGPGIPLEIQTRLFDPFFTTKSAGTGLGLAIVNRRVEQLGGHIAVDSPLGEGGSRFLVSIPLSLGLTVEDSLGFGQS